MGLKNIPLVTIVGAVVVIIGLVIFILSGSFYAPAVDYFKENIKDYEILQRSSFDDTWPLVCLIILIIVLALALFVAICGAKESSGWKKKVSSPIVCMVVVILTFLAAYIIRGQFLLVDTTEEHKKCDIFYEKNYYYGYISTGFIPDRDNGYIYYEPLVDKYCREFLPKLDSANLITMLGVMATQVGALMVLVAASLNLVISRFENHVTPEDVGNRRY
ncbi:hypothetical protein RUM43_012405 [Polyplax serrata]|uniref:Uncharacterized protein n=1 Tax=Polyplax serrata TaxID=468196 RepID=A0AAN8RSY0_POLSC